MKKIVLNRKELPYAVDEEIKLLRTNIRFCGGDKRVILLTSALSDEGKSTVTLNLGYSFADLNKKVLLIDVDFRKSVFNRKVKEGTIEYGLTHYLSEQCEREDIIYETENELLHIAPIGATPPNPSEILDSDIMTNFIAWARTEYDFVLLDCPPIGMVVDAAVVAPSCDGIVLVLESGTIHHRLAQEVKEKLKNTNIPILGVVLNKIKRENSRKYYYSGYGYGYYKKKYKEYY